MLSKPFGEIASTNVATKAIDRVASVNINKGKAYKAEKNRELTSRLRKLARNIATDPSKLFFVKTQYFVLPYFSPTMAAEASP